MKIFISWSGLLSKNIASILNEWIPTVIQATKPFMSSEIEKGAQWFSEIMDELNNSNFSIVCLTPSNFNAPWLLFETGAIAKRFDASRSRVCTLLIGDLTNSALSSPLSEFQSTSLKDKTDMLRLIQTINNTLEENKLDDKLIERSFDKWWPQLEKDVEEAIKTTFEENSAIKQKSEFELLEEILERSRGRDRTARAILNGIKIIVGRLPTTQPKVIPTAQIRNYLREYAQFSQESKLGELVETVELEQPSSLASSSSSRSSSLARPSKPTDDHTSDE